jgi:hypothetical protein
MAPHDPVRARSAQCAYSSASKAAGSLASLNLIRRKQAEPDRLERRGKRRQAPPLPGHADRASRGSHSWSVGARSSHRASRVYQVSSRGGARSLHSARANRAGEAELVKALCHASPRFRCSTTLAEAVLSHRPRVLKPLMVGMTIIAAVGARRRRARSRRGPGDPTCARRPEMGHMPREGKHCGAAGAWLERQPPPSPPPSRRLGVIQGRHAVSTSQISCPLCHDPPAKYV